MMKFQRGASMVEFALIALVFFIIIFGIIEFARVMFVFNTLVEATRRGARVAAVCPVSDVGISQVKNVTIFDAPGGGGNPLLGLTADDVRVTYYQKNMALVTDTGIASATSEDYDKIGFVRVEILPSFTHTLIIPLIGNTFSVPAVETTLPSESLGRVSPENPVTQRCCYGVCV